MTTDTRREVGDWADEKAVETLKTILSPVVTLDDAAKLLAAIFRLIEAKGAQRGLEDAGAALREVFAK